MKINLDSDKLRLLRNERFWSQEQLAEKTGVSPRTIQRIENGGRASHDSAFALANAFDSTIKELLLDEGSSVEKQRPKQINGLELSFRIHAFSFLMGAGSMLMVDLITNPSDWWSLVPVGFWTIGLLCHGGTLLLVKNVEKMKHEVEDRKLAG